jgi:hypothetical protein
MRSSHRFCYTLLVPHFGITVTYFLSGSRPHCCQFGEEALQVGPCKGPLERSRHRLIPVLKGQQRVFQGGERREVSTLRCTIEK